YGLLVTVQKMLAGGCRLGEIDSVTGPMIGRAKSGPFRTLEVDGVGTIIPVGKDVYEAVEGKETEVFNVPEIMLETPQKSWLGAKSGQRFFLKKKGKDGSTIYELNPETLEYEDRKKLKTAATEMAKQAKGSRNKLKALVSAKGDKAGDLV